MDKKNSAVVSVFAASTLMFSPSMVRGTVADASFLGVPEASSTCSSATFFLWPENEAEMHRRIWEFCEEKPDDSVRSGSSRFEEVEEAYGYGRGRQVLMSTADEHSSSELEESSEFCENIVAQDSLNLGYQLAKIANLSQGWQDGCGEVFNKMQLSQLETLFRKNYTLEKTPWIFPAQDHLLLAEWECGSWRLSMEIDLSSLQGDFYALNLENDQEFSHIFNLTRPEEWKILCNALSVPEKGIQA